jgi:hypothetical protein
MRGYGLHRISSMRGGEVLLCLDTPALQLLCVAPLLQFHSFDFFMHVGFWGSGCVLEMTMHLFLVPRKESGVGFSVDLGGIRMGL